jgi:SAM-dependent methyltransferase
VSATLNEVEAVPRRNGIPQLLSPATGYDRWAATYDSDPNPLLHLEERYLCNLLPSFARKRVLDLACGTGRWLEKCTRLGFPSPVGVDISQTMLRVASIKPGLSERIVLGNCTSLPFSGRIFDLVICSFAVWHIPQIDLMARELSRVITQQATVILSDLHPDAYAQGWRTGFRDSSGPQQIQTHPLSVQQLIDIFDVAGLGCLKNEALYLGEPEALIFTRAGKEHAFAEAQRVPAIALFQFRPTVPRS